MTRSRILAVDDDQSLRALLTAVLGLDHDVLTAEDGPSALDLLHVLEEPVDLVILDIMMPGMDGVEVLSRIRSDERTASIPVVVLTARSDDQTHEQVVAAGADAWLTKPYNTEELEDIIDELLADG